MGSPVPEATTSARFLFDSLASAAQGLLTVVLDARKTDSTYTFQHLSANQVLTSGLMLSGQIEAISTKLEDVPGCVRSEE